MEKEITSLEEFFAKFMNDWSMSLAGLLAYGLLMAMLPIVIACIAILGLFLGSSNAAAIAKQITDVFPSMVNQQNVVQIAEKQLANSAGFLLLIAILLAIFGGSRLFITLEGCLDIVHQVRPRPFIRQNLLAIGMFLLFIVLIPVMVFSSAAPTVILASLSAQPQLAQLPFFSAIAHNPLITYLASFIGAIITGFILFVAIYFIMPNRRLSWQSSWPGALTAAIMLGLFLLLFPIYARYALGGYVGQIGFAIILLLFFYYFAAILMLGAEVNAYFFSGVKPLPNDLATFVNITINAQKQEEALTTQAAAKAEQMTQEPVPAPSEVSHREKRKQRKKDQSPQSTRSTFLQVAIGSALAMVIELLRQRRQRT